MSPVSPAQDALRVVHVFPDSARLSCGPSNAILQMMACQIAYGLEVHAISPRQADIPENQRQSIEHLPIVEVEANDFESNLRLLGSMGGDRAVFHFHGIAKWTNRLARHLREKGKQYVFTSHGHLHYYSKIHAVKKLVYLNLVDRFIRNAGGLHYLTQCEGNRARVILPGWSKARLLQPNIVRLPDNEAISAARKPSFGVPEEAFVYLYLGRLDVQHKGLDFAVQAFGEVARDANAYLLLVGPDFANGRQTLEKLAQQVGQPDRVRFPGSQTGPAKWGLLKMADAFVSPSRWEAFSVAQAEAIGSGIPTIVSDKVNAAQDMVANGAALTSALTVPALAKDMRRVMNDANLRRSLSEAGRKWVAEACSPEHAAERFAKFYSSVLAAAR